jgi:hypothetical protein
VSAAQRPDHVFAAGESDYEIYTIKPDGTAKRLSYHTETTRIRGGRSMGSGSFASSRMGFKDEMTYTDAPQPHGELFTMCSDGTDRNS